MTCRRWWRFGTLMLVMGALPAAAFAATPTAADFNAADPKDLPNLVQDVIKSLPTAPTARDAAASKLARDFALTPGVGIDSPRADVRLYVAMMFCTIDALSCDHAYIPMMESKDSAVRYWGAKGLEQDADRLSKAGVTAGALGALTAASKKEPSGIVQTQTIRAVIKYNDTTALIDLLQDTAVLMQKGQPEVSLLAAAADGLDALAKSVGNKVAAAQAAAWLASLTVQYAASMDAAKNLTPEFKEAGQKLVNSAAKVCAAATGKSYKPTGVTELLDTNNTFGFPGGKAGAIQIDLSGVKVPPAITAGQ